MILASINSVIELNFINGVKMNIKNDLDFITKESLITYGKTMAEASKAEGANPPSKPKALVNRIKKVQAVKDEIKQFVVRAQKGFETADDYIKQRQLIIENSCSGDALLFYTAWNRMLIEGELNTLLSSPIGSIQKPIRRRPTSIVPRDQLSPGLTEGRIVIDIGDDRYWLVPKELDDRCLLFTLRHGLSKVDSSTHRVGRRLANTLDEYKGVSKAEAVGKALAKMLGIVGQQLEFLDVPNFLDPKRFKHKISSSPNTKQLYNHIIKSILDKDTKRKKPQFADALESQDFGWVTGVEKKFEISEAARIFGCNEKTAKKLIKNPLYCYPGGQSFFDLYVEVTGGFRKLALNNKGNVLCLYTHSSTLRALIIFLDPRPFAEAFEEFGEYKEKQDNVVLLALEQGYLTGYSTAVGLSAAEQQTRETWKSLEEKRKSRIKLKPGKIKKIVALVSGGDFSGAGAALKELRVVGKRFGIEVYFVRHGFLGLANNWIETVSEEDTRGMVSMPSTPIGSSRFEEFKDERVQDIAYKNLLPYTKDGALVVIGGDGTLRGGKALFERLGVQVAALPGSIDDNIEGTTSLGFHSAVALANQSLESLKATSSAMGSIFFVEIMGAGSGHLALACGFQARAEGVLINEHPDPDAYIDRVILGTLKRTLGVPNKSHLFIVAEKTPHRHHELGGIHGLSEYVSEQIAKWDNFKSKKGLFDLPVATKATILGHTLRGAPPSHVDKGLGQYLAYETVKRLVEDPISIVGCCLGTHGLGHVESIPLHAVKPKQFDWQLFTRMHGIEYISGDN